MEEDGVLFSYRRNREQERGAEIRAGVETEQTAGPRGFILCTKAELLRNHLQQAFVCPVLEPAEEKGSATSLAVPA